jgi:hypothetical protein
MEVRTPILVVQILISWNIRMETMERRNKETKQYRILK